MKTKLLILFFFSFLGMNAIAQSNPDSKVTEKKCQLLHRKTSSKNQGSSEGPVKVDPKNLEQKTNTDGHNIYHNEQDNFMRPDSLPYNPAPLKNDSLKNHYYNSPEEMQSSGTRATPSVNFGFDAEYCTGNTPPDNAMAISNGGKIVSAVNCGIVFYNTSGTLLDSYDYQTFFSAPTNNFSDPRVLYDPYSDRFIFFIQYGCEPSNSVIYIAFSSSNDPEQTWWVYSYDIGTSTGLAPNLWYDYPSIGINQTDFCMTGNLFSGNGCTGSSTFSSNLLLLMNKQDGYDGVSYANMHALYWTDLTDGIGNMGFTIAPASAAQNITYSNAFYLVSTSSGGANYVSKYKITGSASNVNSTIASTSISVQTYSPAGTATQPSGINLANYKAGCRVQNAIYLNNTICFVYTGNYNTGGFDYNSLYYDQINVSSNAVTQNWSYLGGSNYCYPSLGSFGTSQTDKAVILCFLKSDASTKPEMRFKYFDNNMNQLASSLARGGDASVDYSWASTERWGDYTATQRKYNGTSEVWIAGSYGNSLNNWETYIAQIKGYPGNVIVEEVNFQNKDLVVCPNPVQTQLYIKGDFKNFNGFPELYSLDGKLLDIDVTRKDNEMFQIDVSWLKAGVYLIKFKNSQTVKFVKA